MEKITQMYSAFGWHLKDNLMKKYGLRIAKDKNRPCLFFGCYGVQIKKAISWAEKSKVLIWWSGSDITYCFRGREHLIDVVRNHPNISHIATVSFIEEDLKKHGFSYKKVPLMSQLIDDFTPCALGDSVYIYRARLYCKGLDVDKLRGTLPVITTGSFRELSQMQLKEAYAKSFIGVRLLKHDGLSHTVCEMGLMGRKIVWNGDTPNAVSFTDVNDALDKISQISKEGYDPFKVAKEMYDYLNVGDKWLWI